MKEVEEKQQSSDLLTRARILARERARKREREREREQKWGKESEKEQEIGIESTMREIVGERERDSKQNKEIEHSQIHIETETERKTTGRKIQGKRNVEKRLRIRKKKIVTFNAKRKVYYIVKGRESKRELYSYRERGEQ